MPPAGRAERASSFAGVADEYERGRPGYPHEAIEWLLGVASLVVLDLGAGTGKLTSALLDAGHRVIAVEPLQEMREILTSKLPAARALAGTAENLPQRRPGGDRACLASAGRARATGQRLRALPAVGRSRARDPRASRN